ncbi:MAG: hypothetical protein KGL39_47530 [Patescibacteria group bacterium]|nr:hypothetical protein [Patescibacteria group bacterium]
MSDDGIDHSAGAPYLMACGFCGKPSPMAISAEDGLCERAMPICAHCYEIISAMVSLFGLDIRGWGVYQFIHGDKTEGEALPDANAVLEEVERIFKE